MPQLAPAYLAWLEKRDFRAAELKERPDELPLDPPVMGDARAVLREVHGRHWATLLRREGVYDAAMFAWGELAVYSAPLGPLRNVALLAGDSWSRHLAPAVAVVVAQKRAEAADALDEESREADLAEAAYLEEAFAHVEERLALLTPLACALQRHFTAAVEAGRQLFGRASYYYFEPLQKERDLVLEAPSLPAAQRYCETFDATLASQGWLHEDVRRQGELTTRFWSSTESEWATLQTQMLLEEAA